MACPSQQTPVRTRSHSAIPPSSPLAARFLSHFSRSRLLASHRPCSSRSLSRPVHQGRVSACRLRRASPGSCQHRHQHQPVLLHRRPCFVGTSETQRTTATITTRQRPTSPSTSPGFVYGRAASSSAIDWRTGTCILSAFVFIPCFTALSLVPSRSAAAPLGALADRAALRCAALCLRSAALCCAVLGWAGPATFLLSTQPTWAPLT